VDRPLRVPLATRDVRRQRAFAGVPTEDIRRIAGGDDPPQRAKRSAPTAEVQTPAAQTPAAPAPVSPAPVAPAPAALTQAALTRAAPAAPMPAPTTDGTSVAQSSSASHSSLAPLASAVVTPEEPPSIAARPSTTAFDNFQLDHHGSSAASGDAKGSRFTSGMDAVRWGFFNPPLDRADPLLLPAGADTWSPALDRDLI
jgi:hypothetical protein